MKEHLKVKEFMVLTLGGAPIFHYSQSGSRKLDELLSGFLTAITSFASEFGERSVQGLAFEGSEIMYDHADSEALFIFLVDVGAPQKILRAILRDLRKKFMSEFKNELSMDIPVVEVFMGFSSEVQRAFKHYEGILAITSNLSPYVILDVDKNVLELAIESEGLLDEFHRDFGTAGNKILEAIDGKATMAQISMSQGLEVEEVSEIIEYLVIWGVVKIYKLHPILKKDDARFDAFLDIIGLPKKDYQLLSRARALCNGNFSIVEISERVGVTAERLNDVFSKLGDQVKWNHIEVIG
ncbi:MAG: hypothetical protein ACTSV2_18210 [Candidatus Thorarchaeota archaeon]